PPYTYIATINVVLRQHALPVFVDSDPETFQIDHRKIEAALTDRTRAILPVHLGGAASHVDALLEIARRRKIPLIEDACQAQQAERRSENGKYLTEMLKQIPGIAPARAYEGCTNNAYHLYMLRYNAEAFAGLPRATFLKALASEGVPASGGYSPLNSQPFLKN